MASRAPLQIAGLAVVLLGCVGPEPVLYPNPHLGQVGKTQADNDVADCRRLAEQAGASRDTANVGATASTVGAGVIAGAAAGAVGGAIGGDAGIGAAIGAASGATAGLLQRLFGGSPVSQTHKAFVERCLRERGYDPVGWD